MKKNPHAGGRRDFGNVSNQDKNNIPKNWRALLPTPAQYYPAAIAGLAVTAEPGIMSGNCPLHDDRNGSLSVDLSSITGQWRCANGCGSGDLVTFYMRLHHVAFKSAVNLLIRDRALKGVQEAKALLSEPEPITPKEISAFGRSAKREMQRAESLAGSQ